MKIFVVTEISFEYNDEYYYQGESEGGKPVEAYSTKLKAQEAVNVRTKEWLKEISESKWGGITDYGYMDEVINIDQFANESGLNYEETKEAFENHDSDTVNKLILDNLDVAVKALQVDIFKVSEIELNETATTR